MPPSNHPCHGGSRLAGKNILITRQAEFSEYLVEAIRERKGDSIVLPTVEIRYCQDYSQVEKLIRSEYHCRIVIFTSRNAVIAVAKHLCAANIRWPPHLTCAAVGPKTADEIKIAFSPANTIFPKENFGVEGLLQMPQFNYLTDTAVTIVDGGGERSETLRKRLNERGCLSINHAIVYRRILPDVDTAPIRQQIQQNKLDFVIITSVTGAHNLIRLIGDELTGELKRTRVISYSRRITDYLLEQGFSRLVTLDESSDEAVVAALESQCV